MDEFDSGAKNKILNIVILAAAVFAGFYLYNGQLKVIEQLQQQKASEEKKNEILKQIADVQMQVKSVENVLSKKDSSAVMSTVSAFAQDAGVKIASFRPGNEQRLQDYVKSPFLLEVNAPDYHTLGRFINKLETAMDVFIIDNVTIRSVFGQDGQKESLNVSVTVVTISAAD